MSIASELTKLETDITNAYSAIDTKGGTIPSDKNTNNLTAAISSISGGKPEQSKTATPSTSSQTILPDTGYTLSSVTVSAVTSSIDNNIQAGNIKDGVSILGVAGNMVDAQDLINRTVTEITVTAAAKTIRDYLFDRCLQLEKVVIEEGITEIGTYGFYYCSSLTDITMADSIKTIGTHAFDRVPLTGYIKFPASLTSLGSGFRYCANMTAADLPEGVKSIPTNTFGGCTLLDTIIMRSTTLCSLASTSAFTSTPFRGTGGTAYVPSNLISQYQTATNWSTLTVTFVAIEGSEYE